MEIAPDPDPSNKVVSNKTIVRYLNEHPDAWESNRK